MPRLGVKGRGAAVRASRVSERSLTLWEDVPVRMAGERGLTDDGEAGRCKDGDIGRMAGDIGRADAGDTCLAAAGAMGCTTDDDTCRAVGCGMVEAAAGCEVVGGNLSRMPGKPGPDGSKPLLPAGLARLVVRGLAGAGTVVRGADCDRGNQLANGPSSCGTDVVSGSGSRAVTAMLVCQACGREAFTGEGFGRGLDRVEASGLLLRRLDGGCGVAEAAAIWPCCCCPSRGGAGWRVGDRLRLEVRGGGELPWLRIRKGG